MEMRTAAVRPHVLPWERAYAARLFVTDLLIVIVTVFGAQLLTFGLAERRVHVDEEARFLTFSVEYTIVSILLIIGWMLALGFYATRDRKVTGTGSTEYKRIIDGTLRLFGVFAIVVFLLQAEVGRGYLLLALPSGLVLLLFGRWLWRHWLAAKRRTGGYTHRALLLGNREKSEHVAASILRDTAGELRVIGALTRQGSVERTLSSGIPVLGRFDDILEAVDSTGADTVILTGADAIGPQVMRQLGWDLEARAVRLVVAPALTDIAGPRIHARPVAGLPLIHVDFPTFEGRRHSAKRAFDIVASGLGLVFLSPVFLVLVIMVRRDSPGPAFFLQERVGLNGKRFFMHKFRSMVTDAEAQLHTLLDQSDGNGVLFKLKQDPRVTKVGGVLRRYSLDELPQLIDVFRGDMSLVGPRPPLAHEVEQYDDWSHRRLLVKPGITGLWQVSGRSELSWEDSVRLDLYYVENWSLTGDIIILWRTVKAVIRPVGAY
jgi:exopolysaccharide biosynthesis polyprenyl glycosylphosphotransferase